MCEHCRLLCYPHRNNTALVNILLNNQPCGHSIKHLVRADEVDELLDEQEEEVRQQQTDAEVHTSRVCHFGVQAREGKGQQGQGQEEQSN